MAERAATLIRRLLDEQPPRAGSLTVTLFGDCIAEQGATVWLADAVRVLEDFGLNAQQIRTAVYRLGQDGWLDSEQHGRRSLCRLSATGRDQFGRAAERIYAAATPPWDGRWTLVMPARVTADARDELRRRLGWSGFALLTNGVLAHPWPERASLDATLDELGLADEVLVFDAASGGPEQALRELVGDAWKLDDVSQRYHRFMHRFEPALTLLRGGGDVSDHEAFLLRTLLVHEYRRILLRTVDLPPVLLPADWHGGAARELVRTLYGLLHEAAARDACERLRNERGPLAWPGARHFARFGGLPRNVAGDPVGADAGVAMPRADAASG